MVAVRAHSAVLAAAATPATPAAVLLVGLFYGRKLIPMRPPRRNIYLSVIFVIVWGLKSVRTLFVNADTVGMSTTQGILVFPHRTLTIEHVALPLLVLVQSLTNLLFELKQEEGELHALLL